MNVPGPRFHLELSPPPSATALFWFPLPPDPSAVSDGVLAVHAHDFGHPIVAFALVSGSLDCVWASLDPHWNNEGSSPDVLPHVRLVRLGLDSVNIEHRLALHDSHRWPLRRAICPLHRHCYRR